MLNRTPLTRVFAGFFLAVLLMVPVATVSADVTPAEPLAVSERASVARAQSRVSVEDAFDRAYEAAEASCDQFVLVLDETDRRVAGTHLVTLRYACSDIPGC
jgi:hypothetical protein